MRNHSVLRLTIVSRTMAVVIKYVRAPGLLHRNALACLVLTVLVPIVVQSIIVLLIMGDARIVANTSDQDDQFAYAIMAMSIFQYIMVQVLVN